MKVITAGMNHLSQMAAILSRAYFHSLPKSKAHLKAGIREKRCFAALEGDVVIGLLHYIRGFSHEANYVNDLAVDYRHRRKGAATMLLKRYVAVSKREQPKRQRLALSSTDVENKPSIRLHLSCGFKKLGIIKRLHYGKDEIFFGYDLL